MTKQKCRNELNLQIKSELMEGIKEVCESRGMTMSQLIQASISHSKDKLDTITVNLDNETRSEVANLSRLQGVAPSSALSNSLEQYIYKLKYEKAVLDMHDKEREGEDVLMSFKIPRKLKDAFTQQCSKKEMSAAREIRRLMRNSVAKASV